MTDDKRFVRLIQDGLGWGAYGGDEDLYAALKGFMSCIHKDDPRRSPHYDYRELMEKIGGVATWMLIYAFVKNDWIQYGMSPRFAWLNGDGVWLHEYVQQRTAEQLGEILENDDGVIETTPAATV